MYSISEVYNMTKVTIKSLRYYHKEKILVPARIDSHSNYRYYNTENLETLKNVVILRELGFSISSIKLLLPLSHEEMMDFQSKHLEQKRTIYSLLIESINNEKDTTKELLRVFELIKMSDDLKNHEDINS